MHSEYTDADVAEIRAQQSAHKLVEGLRADIFEILIFRSDRWWHEFAQLSGCV